jgi:hypothetical protein
MWYPASPATQMLLILLPSLVLPNTLPQLMIVKGTWGTNEYSCSDAPRLFPAISHSWTHNSESW